MDIRKVIARAFALAALALFLAPDPARAAAGKPAAKPARVQVLAPMTIPGLGRERTVRVYTPPGYDGSSARYPVLYLHDGQNLFDAATSFAGEWEVDESLDRLAKESSLRLIAVGIDNGGEHRMLELTGWDNAKGGKAEGAAYVDFIADVVKPYIDRHYRTQPDRAHTAIMGSSLGGLISHYALMRHGDVFGSAGIFSPSYWYAPASFVDAKAHPLPRDTRLYFYAGTNEDPQMVADVMKMVSVVQGAGLPRANVLVHVVPGAVHNEAAWRREFPAAVSWLFGTGR